jgi:ribonuclease HI
MYNKCGLVSYRDHARQFGKAGSPWSQRKCSIIEGETIALLEAMKEMEQTGFTHVIFEADSKILADAIHKLHSGNSEFSSLICNIKNVVSLNPNYMIKFIKQTNTVAHMLARAVISWHIRYIFDLVTSLYFIFNVK